MKVKLREIILLTSSYASKHLRKPWVPFLGEDGIWLFHCFSSLVNIRLYTWNWHLIATGKEKESTISLMAKFPPNWVRSKPLFPGFAFCSRHFCTALIIPWPMNMLHWYFAIVMSCCLNGMDPGKVTCGCGGWLRDTRWTVADIRSICTFILLEVLLGRKIPQIFQRTLCRCSLVDNFGW